MNAAFQTRFLTNTDETGRFIVRSTRTGRGAKGRVPHHPREWLHAHHDAGGGGVTAGGHRRDRRRVPGRGVVTP